MEKIFHQYPNFMECFHIICNKKSNALTSSTEHNTEIELKGGPFTAYTDSDDHEVKFHWKKKHNAHNYKETKSIFPH